MDQERTYMRQMLGGEVQPALPGFEPPADERENLLMGVLRNMGELDVVTCMVERESLRPAPFNPPIRTQLQYLRDLRASMETHGFLQFRPVLVDRNAILIDGHRRWTVAGLLRIKLIPATIVDADVDEMWSLVNSSAMDLTGAQAFQAVGAGLKTRPGKFAQSLAEIEDVLGPEECAELSTRGISPSMVNIAKRIGRYVSLADDKIFIGMALKWLVNTRHMPSVASRAMREGIEPVTLERAIRGHRPLESAYR